MVNSDKKSVLIVDDNPINVELLNNILSAFDFEVYTALNGHDALEIAYEVHPDALLLDVTMPEMNGYEVCQALKANDTTRTIPVLFVSALTDPSDIEHSYEVGGSDYIIKPFQPLDVIERINKQLQSNIA